MTDKEPEFGRWLEQLRDGDQRAIEQIWELCFDDLVRLAKSKIRNLPRRADDEEDLALSAMHSFFKGASEGRFKKLKSRDDLWQVLIMITSRKAISRYRRHKAEKRGSGKVRGESVFAKINDGEGGDLADFAVDHFAEQLSLESDELLDSLDDEMLKEIALLKLAGHTNKEIAEKIDRAKSTVELKLSLIRKRWEKLEDDG